MYNDNFEKKEILLAVHRYPKSCFKYIKICLYYSSNKEEFDLCSPNLGFLGQN